MNEPGLTELPPAPRSIDVALVGLGPRGLSALERICANAPGLVPGAAVNVHVVDPFPPGAGAVWRTDQDRHLLMNTVASQMSMFTDDSVDLDGPVQPGPSLFEWARSLSLIGSLEGYDDNVLGEARRLRPDSYPTRAFYGSYLDWVFRRTASQAPPGVRIRVYRRRAVALHDAGPPGGPQCLVLADGTRLTGLSAVILAQGHLPRVPDAGEHRLRDHARRRGLRLVAPGNPADADVRGIEADEPVLIRGLGLCFFDYLALLTHGRGGRFDCRDGRLVYRPSGREPRIYAGSRRGVPHQARGENEKGAHGRHTPLVLTPAVVASLRDRANVGGGLDFRRDVWPLIAKEVETVYYTALLDMRGGGNGAGDFASRYLAQQWRSTGERAVLSDVGIPGVLHWDWERLLTPYLGETFADPAAFSAWLVRYLRQDIRQARTGNVHGALKAALDVLRDLRNEVRLVVDHNGLTGRSYRDDLRSWYTPMNAYLSIGPPASRIEEAIALIEAGVLTVVGPDVRLLLDEGGFVLKSPVVPGSPARGTTLIEARLPEPDVRCTADPLLRQLMDAGQVSAYRISDPQAGPYETGGVAVTNRPYRVIDADGHPHPRRFAFGVPTEAVHWVTAAGIRPGVNSVTLGDADAIARMVLTLPARDLVGAVADLGERTDARP